MQGWRGPAISRLDDTLTVSDFLDTRLTIKANNMASATTRCEHCRKRFRIDPNPAFLPCPPADYEGRLKRCPACLKLFTIMLEDSSAVAPPSASVPGWISNPNWIDDIYAGTNRRKRARQGSTTSITPLAATSHRDPQEKRTEPKREREGAPRYNSGLSFSAYMKESGEGIDDLKRLLGLPPLVTGALKTASFIGRLLLSPIDYPMWRAVQQGKMNQWDRVAIQLGTVYLLHRWSKASRKREDMTDQAKCVADAMKRKGWDH
jgi:hypothetical protein